jgi:hypothetical protein
MRQVAKFMDRSPKDIPARYSAIRAHLSKLHHASAGLTAKTLQNHKSNTKSALLWLAREKGVPEHGAPLTAAWENLRARGQGQSYSIEVVVHAVLLGEQHPADRGRRSRGRSLRGISFAVRQAGR